MKSKEVVAKCDDLKEILDMCNNDSFFKLKKFIKTISNLKDTESLSNQYQDVFEYIYNNKILTKEVNLRISFFEKIQDSAVFKEQLKNFAEILQNKKGYYPRTLPTDDVIEIFYFPTMGRMAIKPPYYDSVYPKPFSGVYELYYALASINEIEVLPKELFVDTKDYIDFFILKLLKDCKILPNKGSVRFEEYSNNKTFKRIDDGEDEFLICWLRAVLLGVLNKLIEPPKIKYPVFLNYYNESNSFKLNGTPFKLGTKEASTLKFLIKNSFIEKANKGKYKDYVRFINKKAFAIINAEIITNKRCEPYEFDKKIIKIKEQ